MHTREDVLSDYGHGARFISNVFRVDSPTSFAEISRSSLVNSFLLSNNSSTALGPYEEMFMYPQEKINSEKAVREGLTDYKLDDFSYKLNKYGFRGEWDLEIGSVENSIATFGCSFTFGVGCSIENLWCEILAKNLNKKLYNFGVGGTGVEHSALLYSILSRFTRFDTVVVIVPHFRRMLFPSNKTKKIFFYYNFLHDYKYSDLYMETIRSKTYDVLDDSYFQHRTLTSVESIINCAKANNTKLYIGSWDPYAHHFIKESFSNRAKILPLHMCRKQGHPFARDGSHAGKVVNHDMANIYSEIIKSDSVYS